MDLEVVGRHALQFLDEAAAAFVNSTDALVDWHSLLIDRYDVRHLLSAPPPPRKRRNPQLPLTEPELDHERYLDLPQPSDDQGLDEVANPVEAGGCHAVSFSYGNAEDSADPKISDAGVGCPGFRPPFPLPESLLQSLPPSEKAHQIIARTAKFVSKHGGQSEIILRVKQGDNPTFGFLMPENHLHPYYRFLVDHQELLQSDVDGQDGNGDKKADTHQIQMDDVGGGALSLLGSVYGTGEEDDNAAEDPQESKEVISGDALDPTFLHNSAQKGLSVKATLEEEGSYRHLPSKNKGSVVRKNPPIGPSKAGSTGGKRKEEDSFGSVSISQDKSGLPKEISEIEPFILEPPSEIKRVIDKIVEFIMKNGKQFEAVLIEQDSKHGRFPFLLHYDQYHPYYLRVLQKAQESKLTGKSFISEKLDSCGSGLDKKSSTSKESNLSLKSAGCGIPYDLERREKFKMVIGKSKKDGQDAPSKASQQQPEVSVDAAAAILQAATRGIKNTDFRILSGTSLNSNSHGHSSEGGQSLSLGSAAHKSDQNGSNINSVSLAKVISKTAALDAANEADSSDAHLTLEEKRKAERLKRAKMFVSLLKTGGAPLKTESLCALSAEPQGSGFSGSASDFVPATKAREGSLAPLDVGASDNNGMSEKKVFVDEYNERRLMRKYRSRSSRLEEEQDDVEERKHKHSRKKHQSRHSRHEDDKKEETEVEERDGECSKKLRSRRSSHGDDDAERDHKHLRKKHRSHHSSHEDDDDDDERGDGKRDHRKSKKKRHSYDSSHYEEDEDKEESDHKHSRSQHLSHCSSHHSRDRHKHRRSRSSRDRESGHHHKHGSSSEDDHVQLTRSDKHRKAFHSEELEEGEISAKTSDHSRGSIAAAASREASVDLSSSSQQRRTPSQPPETTEVADDLRAKIRAMLRATM